LTRKKDNINQEYAIWAIDSYKNKLLLKILTPDTILSVINYIFYLIEALQQAAKGLNLDEGITKELITEMIKGSSTLASLSEDSPSLLREKVTSPGGVTEKALEVLNEREVGDSIVEAILKATEKSKDLGES